MTKLTQNNTKSNNNDANQTENTQVFNSNNKTETSKVSPHNLFQGFRTPFTCSLEAKKDFSDNVDRTPPGPRA